MLNRRQFLGAAAAASAFAGFPALRLGRAAETPLKQVVVLMQENRSFDHYFGLFPGADGLPPCAPVTHAAGACLTAPPHTIEFSRAVLGSPDLADGFARLGGPAAMTYYDGRDLPFYWALAARFTLCDRYFCSALGGTLLNRVFSVAGAPGGIRDNDGFTGAALPGISIADRLDEAGVDWRCYQAGEPDAGYNAIRYFPNRRSDARADRPYAEFLSDAASGRLPPVSWVVTEDPLSEHGPDDVGWGERFAALTINSLASGPQWKDSALVLSYDENGGIYDHLRPPAVDEFGLGFRVPAVIVSPFARAGRISSSVVEHCSTLALIERTFGLRSMGGRDTAADPFQDAFDFSRRELSFIAYRPRPLTTCATPSGWSGGLLDLPVPGGRLAGPVPEPRALCHRAPEPDLAMGAAAGTVVAAAGAAGLLARRRAGRPGEEVAGTPTKPASRPRTRP